jgi:hypothetical protein
VHLADRGEKDLTMRRKREILENEGLTQKFEKMPPPDHSEEDIIIIGQGRQVKCVSVKNGSVETKVPPFCPL